MTLEIAVRRRAAGVDDALGDPLVIEMRDLLAEDEVLEERRPAQAGLERALIVANRHALIGGQLLIGGVHAHPVERSNGLVVATWGSSASYFLRPVQLRHRAGTNDRIGRNDGLAGFGSRRGLRVVLERFVGVEREAGRELLRSRELGGEIVGRRCGIRTCGTTHRGAAITTITGRLGIISTCILGFRHRSYGFVSHLACGRAECAARAFQTGCRRLSQCKKVSRVGSLALASRGRLADARR